MNWIEIKLTYKECWTEQYYLWTKSTVQARQHLRKTFLSILSVLEARMLVKPFVVILALAVAFCDGVNRGSIQVEGYGEVWVISPDWANVQVDSARNSFTLHGNSRMYFANRGILLLFLIYTIENLTSLLGTDGFEADAYWQVRGRRMTG